MLRTVQPLLRINRNIVECKVTCLLTIRTRLFGINRNIVECKAFHTFTTVALYPVLIETLWNVKEVPKWAKQLQQKGINRNIVECKGSFFS